ncbi:MAG: hopanoid-associated sugar epimerase, partial [Candidatus Acidiferrales bacterium]
RKYARPTEGRSLPNTMTTLVTGATGFVGSHVARRLVTSGESVRALARQGSRRQGLEGVAVEWVEGDLRDEASLDRALAGVNRVYHLAADYRLWSRHPQEIYDSNVTGTKNLLAAALRARVERFVYTSTVATIAVPREGALPDETNRASVDEMIGNYKRSKLLAEQEALRAAHEGLPAVIVNPTTPVGPGDWKPTPTGRIILDFLLGRMPAYVHTGLNFVAVEDVAEGHLLVAERGKIGERYLLGGRNMTLKELLDALARITGLAAPTRRIPHSVALMAAFADAAYSRVTGCEPRIPIEGVRIARHKMFVNDEKARKELGYQPGAVEAALERAVRWYVANGYVTLPKCAPVAQVSAA